MEQERNSFFEPQRQSRTGIALLFLYSLGQTVRNSWALLFIFIFKRKDISTTIILLIVLAVFLLLIVSAILKYYNFKYYIDPENEEFIIHQGIINKSTIKIKKDNIQEVNISQPFIHHIFNIYKLEIDTPGGTEKEISISALSHKNAVDLKKYLLAENNVKSEKKVDVQEENTDDKVLAISTQSLIKYGFTANYVQSFFALISLGIYGIYQINDVLDKAELETRVDYEKLSSRFMTFSIPVIGGLIFLVIVLGVIINVIRTLIRYHHFKIIESDRRFSMEYGLFNTKNSIVTKNKVQIVTETQNWIQKKLNVSFIKFLQIGKKDDDEKNTAAIPGIHKKEKEKLIFSIWQEEPDFKNVLQPNYRLLILNNIKWIVFPLILVCIIDRNLLLDYGWLAVLYFIIVELFLIISFLHLKLYYSERFIRLQSGIWDIDYRTFEIEKLQTVKISQYFWQRKANLGTITLYTSAGKFGFSGVDFSKAKKLFNYIIYKIEISKNYSK
ncbi:PH domain-containing protein [Chryseobacterium sp. Alg-005]